MITIYEKYFGSGDVNEGKTQMMLDIKRHRLFGKELAELIDELEARDMLTSKHYTPEPKERWDADYLHKLSGGHISDYFSRDFLEHFGEVAEYVYKPKEKKPHTSSTLNIMWIIPAVLVVLIILLICRRFF